MGYPHKKNSPRLLPEDENSPVIGAQLAANMLGINVFTLGLWVKEGKVAPTKIVETGNGPVRRWSKADIERLRERLVYKKKQPE
jgi:predicted site-specific integrase-resolvase